MTMDCIYLTPFLLCMICCLVHSSQGYPSGMSSFYSTPPVNVTVVESQTLRLKCTPRNMNNDIIWSKISPSGEEQPLRQYPEHRFLFEMFDQILIVKGIEREDSGKFKCAVTDRTNILEFAVINVQVHTIPHWRQVPEDLLLHPGETGEIQCSASGIPPPMISWQVDDNTLTFGVDGTGMSDTAGNSKFYLNGTKLVITDAQYEDAAKIRCIASNDYGKILTDVYLDVLEMPPRFLHTPHSVSQVVTGNDITIKCTAVGSPKPVISWTLNSMPVNRDLPAQANFALETDGSLTIYRIKKSYDEDMYMCKAENTLGHVIGSGELRVRARTRVECHVAQTIAKKGKNIFLRCSVQTDPSLQATVTWVKNGKPLNPGCSNEDRIFQPPELGVDDFVLVIRSITRADSGVYGCVAKTELDKSADQTTLIVQDVPDRPGPVEIIQLTETSVNLTWAAGNENNSTTELFILYMKSTWKNNGMWEILKMLPPGSRNAILDLKPWTSYTFRVKQLNGVGYSELSEASATYRTAPSRPYSNPENVRANSTNISTINVYWKPLPPRQFNGPGFYYVISWRRLDGEDTWKQGRISNPLAGYTTIPTNGEYGEYEIRVRAGNDVGMAPTPWSQTIDVFPMSESNDHSGTNNERSVTRRHIKEPSGSPQNFQEVVISSTEIKVSWNPIDRNQTGGALQGYMIRYWKQGSAQVREITTPSTKRMFTLSDLIPASEYVIHMLGFNQAGEGPTTNNIVASTPKNVPAAGPVTNFTVSAEGGTLHVEWDEPTSSNGVLLGYHIIVTRYDGLEIVDVRVYKINPDETRYTLRNLAPDTTLRVEIQASTKAGLGVYKYWEGRTP